MEADTYTGSVWDWMSVPYTPPSYEKEAFNCPFCGAYSNQLWYRTSTNEYHPTKEGDRATSVADFALAYCARCLGYSCWYKQKMIYPSTGMAPPPNPDLPKDIKTDYEEARSISSTSPRGAAAILRLAIQRLCIELGEEGKDLNTDIANLMKKGLNEKVQKALNSVRVIGNEAVNPGQMDPRDDAETVRKLFGLVNLIVEMMITQPKRVDEI
jgi:hypothetical protein